MSMNLYKRKKPVVGETYFVSSNYYYKTTSEKGCTVKVVNVGRKYFTVKAEGSCIEYKFDKNTFVHNNGVYSPEFNIYNNEEDYQKNIKATQCKNEIMNSLLKYLTWDETITLYERLKNRKEEASNGNTNFENILI